MDKNFLWENQRKYAVPIAVIAGVYFFMKFLSPVLSPFILAFLAVSILSRLTDKVSLKVKKPVVAGFLLIVILILLFVLMWMLGGLLMKKCGELTKQIPYYEGELCGLLNNCCRRMEDSFGIDGAVVEHYILEQVNIFVENLEVNILPAVMNKSMLYAKSAAGAVGFLIVWLIAVFLILKDYDHIWAYIRKKEDFKGVLEIAGKAVLYVKTYLKAQLTLLLIISSVCGVSLGILRIEGGIIYGIITGFMDMLPFIGTGIMLVPLAFFQLLSNHYVKAAVILCLYGVCAFIREFLEPRLIGSKVGIWPVGILFSVFAGVKLFGIFGIIKGPIGLVVIFETCKYFLEEKGAPC